MSNNNNILSAKTVHGIGKNGPYRAIEFSIQTPSGTYTTRSFPTTLEFDIIEKTLNSFNGIYSNDNQL